MPELNSRKIISYCEKIVNVLDSNERSLEHFLEVISIIDSANLDLENKRQFKDRQTTEDLLSLV